MKLGVVPLPSNVEKTRGTGNWANLLVEPRPSHFSFGCRVCRECGNEARNSLKGSHKGWSFPPSLPNQHAIVVLRLPAHCPGTTGAREEAPGRARALAEGQVIGTVIPEPCFKNSEGGSPQLFLVGIVPC